MSKTAATLAIIAALCCGTVQAEEQPTQEDSLWIHYLANQKKPSADEQSAFAASLAGTQMCADEFQRKAASDLALNDVVGRVASAKKKPLYQTDITIALAEYDFKTKTFPVYGKSVASKERVPHLPQLVLIVDDSYHIFGSIAVPPEQAQSLLASADRYRQLKAHLSCSSFTSFDSEKSATQQANFSFETPASATEFAGFGPARFLMCSKYSLSVEQGNQRLEVKIKK